MSASWLHHQYGEGSPDLCEVTWTCHVCGEARPDEVIGVAYRPAPPVVTARFPTVRFHVRYCTDRPDCVAVAHEEGPWLGSPRRRGAAP